MAQVQLLHQPDEVRPVLVCDLDGTLIHGRMKDEDFWSYAATRRPAEAAHLPYREEVLDRLQAHRASGGRTVLVSGVSQAMAEDIAAELGVFDEAYGAEALNGQRTGDFLKARFGEGGYAFLGGPRSDRWAFAAAAEAVTVGLPDGRRGSVTAQGPVTHLDAETQNFPRALMATLRPHQWLKNLLIFLPLLAAHRLDGVAVSQAMLAFLAFCMVASSVYVLNDLLDLPSDRAHPRKRKRPFASGRLALRHGAWLAPGLLLLGFGFGALLGPVFVAVLGAYYLTTMTYSFWLKTLPVMDICTLAALYTLRLAAGAAAAGIPLSVWLLAFSIFFFFALAAVKRQAELMDAVKAGRALNARRGYRAEDLPLVAMMAVGSGYVSVLVMALYVNSLAGAALYSTPELLFGICAVLLFWISRVVLLAHRGEMHDDPVVFAARDPVSLGAFLVVCAFVVAGTQV